MNTVNFGIIYYLKNESVKDYVVFKEVNEVLTLNGQLLVHIVDAETGQRGFILTSKSSYLEPYYDGIKQASHTLSVLKAKSVDDQIQLQRLNQLQELMMEKFAELHLTIELHRTGKSQQALEIINSDKGKLLMDDIREKVTQYAAYEDNTLEQRRNELNTLLQLAQKVFIAETLMFLIAVLIVAMVISKTIIDPIRALYQSAKTFEEENTFTPVDINGKDEIGTLAHAFNSMANKMLCRVTDLNELNLQAQKERDQARLDSLIDPLTGLFNRRVFAVEFEKLVDSSKRYGHELSVMMFDVDFFKEINDNLGHSTGDKVLAAIGNVVKDRVRGSDLAIRYGGDEFVVVLSHTGYSDCVAKAESLRQSIAALEIPELGAENITISVGVASYDATEDTPLTLLDKADNALYLAKREGRNCVRCA
ncbi:diguanylate cyclase [Pseudoalteromonas sp. SSDWG2]|uniref:GGDEF domain-containing protein n=1 Tax=Pseudoalteromonas sp. SSDWG2 TaxID=3139391 RepID=UPI003BAD6CA4